jgi:hypothetical protein
MKRILFVLVAIHFFNGAHAQPRFIQWYEAHTGLGGIAMFGDIGSMGLGPVTHLGLRYRQNRYLAINLSVETGMVSGSDAGTRNENRDYSYRTILAEPSVRAELYFFSTRAQAITRRGLLIDQPKFSAYVFVGLGFTWYNPKPGGAFITAFNDEIPRTAITMPIGLAANYPVGKKITLGVELGVRYLNTDYIDGYTSQNSAANDLYYLASFNLSYRLNRPLFRL